MFISFVMFLLPALGYASRLHHSSEGQQGGVRGQRNSKWRAVQSSEAQRSCSSTSEMNCLWNALPRVAWPHRDQESASAAAKPSGLQEPPLPAAVLAVFCWTGVFSDEVCLDMHMVGKVCLYIDCNLWTVSFFPAIYNLEKNRTLIDLFSTYFKLKKMQGIMWLAQLLCAILPTLWSSSLEKQTRCHELSSQPPTKQKSVTHC